MDIKLTKHGATCVSKDGEQFEITNSMFELLKEYITTTGDSLHIEDKYVSSILTNLCIGSKPLRCTTIEDLMMLIDTCDGYSVIEILIHTNGVIKYIKDKVGLSYLSRDVIDRLCRDNMHGRATTIGDVYLLLHPILLEVTS